jgi:hypothetical protein
MAINPTSAAVPPVRNGPGWWAGSDPELRGLVMSTTTPCEIRQDASRKRRYSDDPARRRWYALSRALRFRRRYFETPR